MYFPNNVLFLIFTTLLLFGGAHGGILNLPLRGRLRTRIKVLISELERILRKGKQTGRLSIAEHRRILQILHELMVLNNTFLGCLALGEYLWVKNLSNLFEGEKKK